MSDADDPWKALLSRVLDGETLTDEEAAPLTAALADPAKRKLAKGMLRLESGLRDLGSHSQGFDLTLSREKLLAKGALREKSASVRGERQAGVGLGWLLARRKAIFATTALAGAAAIVVFIGNRPPAYPVAQASGDFKIQRNGAALPAGAAPMTGDHLVVGPGGAMLLLGGYASLRMDAAADVVLAGQPGNESIVLNAGRVVSSVRPGHGLYDVVTPLGTVSVLGTEFVTDVRLSGERERATVVEVAVAHGRVKCVMGEEERILTDGQKHVFGKVPESEPQGGRTDAVILSVDGEGVRVKTEDHEYFIEAVNSESTRDLMHLRVGDQVRVDWIRHGADKAVVNVVGELIGRVVEKDKAWLRVLADGETEPRRLGAIWSGGDPDHGGGLDKAMLARIAAVKVGDRVLIRWGLAEGARLLDLEPAP